MFRIWPLGAVVSYEVIFLAQYFKFLYEQKLQRDAQIILWPYSYLLSTHFHLKMIDYTVPSDPEAAKQNPSFVASIVIIC